MSSVNAVVSGGRIVASVVGESVVSASVSPGGVSASVVGGIGPQGVPGNIGPQGAGATTLSQLTDVSLSSVSGGDVLRFDSTKWVNFRDKDLTDGGAF